MAGACEVVSANMSTWSPCIIKYAFFGSAEFTTLAILCILAYIAFKMNLPHETSLMLAVGTIITMGIIFPTPALSSLMVLMLVILAIYSLFAVKKMAGNR